MNRTRLLVVASLAVASGTLALTSCTSTSTPVAAHRSSGLTAAEKIFLNNTRVSLKGFGEFEEFTDANLIASGHRYCDGIEKEGTAAYMAQYEPGGNNASDENFAFSIAPAAIDNLCPQYEPAFSKWFLQQGVGQGRSSPKS